MRATKDLLRTYNLFDNLPPEFKELEERQFFVLYYNVNEEAINLNIFEYEIVQQVNVALYRGIHDRADKHGVLTLNIAYFKGDTYETRDGIFYMFLRTYNDPEKVRLFYQDIMQQDVSSDLNVSTNAFTDVNSAEDFKRSISYYSPNRMQAISFVYDMVNSAFKRRLSKNLYGDLIKRVVNMVKYDGGVLNEIGGELRFMVIGEQAKLTEEQQVKLNAAKLLLRSLQSPEEIYKSTGWYFSNADGKWRTNISDDWAGISNAFMMVNSEGTKLYRPQECNLSVDDILSLFKNPERMYAYGYNGKLWQVLNHPTLFEYYPKLANMPILYMVIDDDKNKNIPQVFYYNDNARGGYIVINGSTLYGSVLSTLLHETQHAIQRIEGYATGGNQFFAKFVASVGGKSVRKIFASINRIERVFREQLLTNDARMELWTLLEKERPRTNEAKGILQQIKALVSDKENYAVSGSMVNFMLVIYVAENKDGANNSIVIWLQGYMGDVIFDLLENITIAYNEAMAVLQKLANEGYKKDDINRILFSSYENLYGEMESRSVQASRYVTSEYRNYFYLTKWEHSPVEQLTVIDGIEKVLDTKNIKAAVERKGDDYVLHFNRSGSCVPFLHELGHIVYDAMVQCGYQKDIEAQYANNLSFEDIEEYFVSRFLGYIKNNVDNNDLVADMKADYSIDSEEGMDELFDAFFTEPGFDERLDYAHTLLSLTLNLEVQTPESITETAV